MLTLESSTFWRENPNDGVYSPFITPIRMGTPEQPRYGATAPSGTISWQAMRHVFASVLYTRFLTGDFFQGAPPPNRNIHYPRHLDCLSLLTFSWGRAFRARRRYPRETKLAEIYRFRDGRPPARRVSWIRQTEAGQRREAPDVPFVMSITIFPSTCWLPSAFRNMGICGSTLKIGIVGLGVNRGRLARRSQVAMIPSKTAITARTSLL
jgi:hypothetical protein